MAAFHSAFVGKRQSPVDEPSVKPHWLAARPVAAWFAAAYVFAPKQFAFFSQISWRQLPMRTVADPPTITSAAQVAVVGAVRSLTRAGRLATDEDAR
jgi:hypothetical protein